MSEGSFYLVTFAFLFLAAVHHHMSIVSASLDNSTYASHELNYEKVFPCFDRTPHCKHWAKSAECRKRNALIYMQSNCPATCNLCNPLFQPWTPVDTSNNKMTYNSQAELGILIHVGVDQKMDFEDSVMSKFVPSFDAEWNRRRILDVEKGQRYYLDRYYKDIHIRDGSGKNVSSIDMDQPIPHKRMVPYLEDCVNSHPYCFYWASRGFCESQPFSMSDICAPACQICRWMIYDTTPKIIDRRDQWFPSAFKRNDIIGILEAIHENRVPVDSMGTKMMEKESLIDFVHSKDTNDEITHSFYTEDNMKSFHKFNRTDVHINALKEVLQGEEAALGQSGVVVMDDFFSFDESQSILAELKSAVDKVSRHLNLKERSNDNFPIMSASNDGEKLRRQSSFVLVYSAKNESEESPYLETLYAKLSMLLTIPLDHIETTSLVEKFGPGDFRHPSMHFRSLDYDQVHNVSNLEFADNARVFGVMIFLNDVKGGEIVFPNMNNLTIGAKVGRIVIFPTVISLLPVRKITKEAYQDIKDSLFDSFIEKSYLIEDSLTFHGHQKVEEGTKYTLTIYFRRRPLPKVLA